MPAACVLHCAEFSDLGYTIGRMLVSCSIVSDGGEIGVMVGFLINSDLNSFCPAQQSIKLLYCY